MEPSIRTNLLLLVQPCTAFAHSNITMSGCTLRNDILIKVSPEQNFGPSLPVRPYLLINIFSTFVMMMMTKCDD